MSVQTVAVEKVLLAEEIRQYHVTNVCSDRLYEMLGIIASAVWKKRQFDFDRDDLISEFVVACLTRVLAKTKPDTGAFSYLMQAAHYVGNDIKSKQTRYANNLAKYRVERSAVLRAQVYGPSPEDEEHDGNARKIADPGSIEGEANVLGGGGARSNGDRRSNERQHSAVRGTDRGGAGCGRNPRRPAKPKPESKPKRRRAK